MLLILAPTTTFAQLARWLDERSFELTRVVSCTFPGRPEPKEALWANAQGQPSLKYIYEPDVELRALWQTSPHAQSTLAQLLEEHPEAFVSWERLTQQLHDPESPYIVIRGAGAAWRLRARQAEHTAERAQAQQTLIHALQPQHAPLTRRCAAHELGLCADVRALEALERSAQDDPDLEVRMYARQAAQQLQARASLRLDRAP